VRWESSQELTPEKSRSSRPKKNVKLPTLQAWDSVSRNEEDSVLVFLPRLAQYLDASNVSKDERMDHVLPFLKGRAFMLWQLEAERMANENEVPTWTHFEKFMKDSFGITAPERHARKKWDRLTQAGNVFKYVQETKSGAADETDAYDLPWRSSYCPPLHPECQTPSQGVANYPHPCWLLAEFTANL